MLKFFPLKAALVGRSGGMAVYVILSLPSRGAGYSIVQPSEHQPSGIPSSTYAPRCLRGKKPPDLSLHGVFSILPLDQRHPLNIFGLFSTPFSPEKDIPSLAGKVLIITGANAGLGYE